MVIILVTCWDGQRPETRRKVSNISSVFIFHLDFGVLAGPRVADWNIPRQSLQIILRTQITKKGAARDTERAPGAGISWASVSARIKIGLDRIPSWLGGRGSWWQCDVSQSPHSIQGPDYSHSIPKGRQLTNKKYSKPVFLLWNKWRIALRHMQYCRPASQKNQLFYIKCLW